jgi:hypothetical protein
MERVRRPNRFGLGLTAAALLSGLAVVLWLVALSASWGSDCPRPGRGPEGLDKGVTLWPPGAQCYAGHPLEGYGQATTSITLPLR